MFQKLPEDVEEYILNFLILPLDVCKVNCISKYFKKKINKLPFIKEKKIIYERIRIIAEEYSDPEHNLTTRGRFVYPSQDLAEAWTYYYKWNWPKIQTEKPNYTRLWKVGDYVDVKDKIGVWANAIILECNIETQKLLGMIPIKKIRKYRVQFLGWGDDFNENVAPEKITFLGTKTLNPHNLYDSISRYHKRWVLHNDGNEWRVRVLKPTKPPQDDFTEDISLNNMDISINDISLNDISNNDLVSNNNNILLQIIENDTVTNYIANDISNVKIEKKIPKNEKIVEIINFENASSITETLTPENINNKLRCTSNATLFLTVPYRRFIPLYRDFKL